MEKIRINASVDYDVLIDSGLLKEAGELIFSALLPASGVSATDPLAARRQAENTTARPRRCAHPAACRQR